MSKISNMRITREVVLPTPEEVVSEYPVPEAGHIADVVSTCRKDIQAILSGEDQRLLVVLGPCSIHEYDSALEYAKFVRELRAKYGDQFLFVMRVYFEKPRTTVGWKGLIDDPDVNGTSNIPKGIKLARKILHDINSLGVPAGVEWLDVITPQYLSDLVSWGAIGARTVESQEHRELAAGSSMPIGFKNGTSGSIQVAVNAILAAQGQHAFVSVNMQGQVAAFDTDGNFDTHVILRGGETPNYSVTDIAEVCRLLKEKSLPERVVVDCSHANAVDDMLPISEQTKDYRLQPQVFLKVIEQRTRGNAGIVGLMVESHLKAGKQTQPVEYGQSITDACIDLEATEQMIVEAYQILSGTEQLAA